MGQKNFGRKADITETKRWHGKDLAVEVWVEPTEFEWDGEGEAPSGGGWDVFVDVSTVIEGVIFTGPAALFSCWGDHSFIQDIINENVFPMAVEQLEDSICRIADGSEVAKLKVKLDQAKREQSIARWVTKLMKKDDQTDKVLWEAGRDG